jgi:hypothetical protein
MFIFEIEKAADTFHPIVLQYVPAIDWWRRTVFYGRSEKSSESKGSSRWRWRLLSLKILEQKQGVLRELVFDFKSVSCFMLF